MEESLINISPIDGRYRDLTEDVRSCFSEYHLIKNRIVIEIKWLEMMSEIPEIDFYLSNDELVVLEKIIEKFDLNEGKRVKEIESTTKHDVKAVEYYIDDCLKENGLERCIPYVHFLCTSEDINNLAYGLMEKTLLEEVYIKNVQGLIDILVSKANEYSNVPMLSHTHGQPATPTTVGKELANFAYRMNKVLNRIKVEKFAGKFNGTVGNYNAHFLAYPNVNWLDVSKKFVEMLGLEFNPYTTQIEPHDNLSIIFSEIKLLNNILLDFNNDMWMYISRNYFSQENVAGEIGSSVMPHKINPINFENSMANCKMSNGIIDVFTDNLQISRMQRDLSDSSLLRNIGSVFAYCIIAIKQTIRGIKRVSPNESILKGELDNNPEILAEAVQTILRKNGYNNAYDILKEMTRGKEVSLDEIRNFINNLNIDVNDKNKLMELVPENYTGLADKLANELSK